MSASLRWKVGLMSVGVCCAALTYAMAQQIQSSREPGASGQTDRSPILQSDRSTTPATDQPYNSATRRTANYRGDQKALGGSSQAVDRYLASCLLFKNQAEVQLSEIAQQKSENAEVKQFAQQMIQDHRKLIEQLQPLAAMQRDTIRGTSGTRETSDATTRTSDAPALPGSPDASPTTSPSGIAATPSTDTTKEVRTGAAVADRLAAGGGLHQLGQIEKQIGDRCLQMAKEELQQKSGAEFDKCFVASAIGAHMHALAELEVIGKQTQGKLAQVAQAAQPTVQQHLEHAKQLMAQLEGKANATGSQAERSSTRTER